MFCSTFEKVKQTKFPPNAKLNLNALQVNEKVREKMFNLRQTWNEVFPQTKLYALDVKVNVIDNNWPITAKIVPKSVHVNPNFLKSQAPDNRVDDDLVFQMQAKQRELLVLERRKIELELMVTKKKIAESEKEMREVSSELVKICHVSNSSFSFYQTRPLNIPTPTVSSSVAQNTTVSFAQFSSHRIEGPNSLVVSQIPPQMHGRVRIAPVNAAMISSARSRDPRLMRMRPSATPVQQQNHHMPLPIGPISIGSGLAKSLPRIPKFSQSNNHASSNNERNHDPRSRRKEEQNQKSLSKGSPSSSKNKSLKSSSGRSSDRKKSGSSDDSSPRKKSDSSKSSTSHRSRSRSSKSPMKDSRDVDLRVLPHDMKPDSTTSSKSSKDKLLSDLLNGEDLKSNQEMITTDDNGKENKPILVVTIITRRFIVAYS